MAEDDIARLRNRFSELAERANASGVWQQTKFLSTAEQSVLLSMRLPVPIELWGGFEGAERRVALFGSEELMGYPASPAISCLEVTPTGAKFAGELTHRDHLGALMALGLTRETIGDIVLSSGAAYVFCVSSVAEHIKQNLVSVGRAAVVAEDSSLPETIENESSEAALTVASERLDALISAVWRIPREEAKLLCEKGLVFVDSREATKAGAQLKPGAAVSVRGHGRFYYLGVERETKKGRLRVNVRLPGKA